MLQPKTIVSTIPMYRVRQLLEGAKRSGVALEELLQEAGIPEYLLEQPEARIEKRQCIHLMLSVMRRTEDEFMGFGVGRVSKPGTFSMMAHAVINCANLEKAIRRSQQFYELFDYGVQTRLERRDEETALKVVAPPDTEFREFIVESVVFLWIRFMSWLIGQQIVPKYISFDFPSTSEGEEYSRLFSCPVLFGHRDNQIVLESKYLDLPLVQNPISLSRFLRDSLRELIDGNIQNASLNAQIRSIISKEFGHNFPDFSVICEKLNMTPQTLRRRLKEENTSYQEIKDSIRKDASVYYLSKPELSIDEIALLMGFSEASSFHRAFKKWTGKTPSAYRAALLEQADRFGSDSL